MATINVHQAKDGIKTYRVRVRRKGEPAQTASFATLKDARQWATMSSYMVQAGIPLYTVGAILGHSSRSTAMTARYAHLAAENLRDALETLSQRLSS